jgi:transcriptional regulator with XRE-family HTH domain
LTAFVVTPTFAVMRREALGARIERLRGLTGLSARGLARLAGLHGSHVWTIESSASEQVSASTLRRIADVFGVTIDWLFDGEGEGPTPDSLRKAVARARRARDRSGTGEAA